MDDRRDIHPRGVCSACLAGSVSRRDERASRLPWRRGEAGNRKATKYMGVPKACVSRQTMPKNETVRGESEREEEAQAEIILPKNQVRGRRMTCRKHACMHIYIFIALKNLTVQNFALKMWGNVHFLCRRSCKETSQH